MPVAELLDIDKRRKVRMLNVRNAGRNTKQFHCGDRPLMPNYHHYVRAALNQRIRKVCRYEPIPAGKRVLITGGDGVRAANLSNSPIQRSPRIAANKPSPPAINTHFPKQKFEVLSLSSGFLYPF